MTGQAPVGSQPGMAQQQPGASPSSQVSMQQEPTTATVQAPPQRITVDAPPRV